MRPPSREGCHGDGTFRVLALTLIYVQVITPDYSGLGSASDHVTLM